MNLGRLETDQPDVEKNFHVLAQTIGVSQFALCSQVHGAHVEEVTEDFPFTFNPAEHRQADAMVTTMTNVALVIRVADCLPVLFADTQARIIGAAHAGRQGLLAGVLEATVDKMRQLGADQIQAWIGPHVCVGCYEVPSDMAHDVWECLPATRGSSHHDTPAVDLGAGACSILTSLNIDVHQENRCTSCEPEYFSHRRDRGQTGRQAGVIWLETPHTWAC